MEKSLNKKVGKGILNNVMRNGDFVWIDDNLHVGGYHDQDRHNKFTKEIAKDIKKLKSDRGEINHVCRLLSHGLTPFEIRQKTYYPIDLIHQIRRGEIMPSVSEQYPEIKHTNRRLDAVYRLLADGKTYGDVSYLIGDEEAFPLTEYCHRELEMDGCVISEHKKYVNLTNTQIDIVRQMSYKNVPWPDIAEKLDIAEDYIAIINYSDGHFKTNSPGLYTPQERYIMYGNYSPWQKLYDAMFYTLPDRDPMAFEVEALSSILPYVNSVCTIKDGYNKALFPKDNCPEAFLCLRFGINSDGTYTRSMSFKALSEQFNIPISQVKLIIDKAVRRLRLDLSRPCNKYLLEIFNDRPETYQSKLIPTDVNDWPISCLQLSPRISTVLHNRDIKTIGEAIIALDNNEAIGKQSMLSLEVAVEPFKLNPDPNAHEYIPEYPDDINLSDSIDKMRISIHDREILLAADLTLVGHVVDAYHSKSLSRVQCSDYWSIVHRMRQNHLIPADRFK